jgi:Zn-dependent peptidase ImmA (M78 family)
MAKKSIKMPQAFNVFGQTVNVIYHNEPLFVNERPAYGYYDYSTFTVHIAPHENKDELVKTILHELGHSIMDRIGLVRTSVHNDLFEIIVEAYSRFIHDNFKLKLPKKSRKPSTKPSKKAAKR